MRSIKISYIMITAIMAVFSCNSDQGLSDGNPNSTGQGGSMTRFGIYEDYLYVLGHSSIEVFNIEGDQFENIGNVEIGAGMETIFVNGTNLYLGANDAMFIYSLANPASPQFQFRYSHVTSCDPVVVQGDRAYVTMRGGSMCNAGTNALEILDISDPQSPTLIQTYGMMNPHGLGITGDILFICEGEFGLRVFNVENPGSIEELHYMDDFHAYDVIVRPNHAIVTGLDGIFQFTFNSDGSDIERISTIPVSRVEL